MLNRDDIINVICDHCGEEFKEQITRLDSIAVYICPHCKAGPLEPNPQELKRLLAEEVDNNAAYLRVYVVQ